MFFLLRWISGSSLWFSSLLIRILSTTGWLLGIQRKSKIEERDVEGGQDVVAGDGVVQEHAVTRRQEVIFKGGTEYTITEWNERSSKGEFISGGASGIVERLPSGDVVKSPWSGSRAPECRRGMTTEVEIYRRLGPHQRLAKIINWDAGQCCLMMEYLPNGNLKDYLRAHDEISMIQRLQWMQEAAEGLQLLHSANVVHCDVEPKNFLLDAELGLRIADFSGSSLDGSQPLACAGARFIPPSFNWRSTPTIQDDLYSFGSTIYTILTSHYPYQELSSDEVTVRYKAHQFPDLTGIPYGQVIERCWRGEIASAQEIYDFIQAEKENIL